MKRLTRGDSLELLCPYCDHQEWNCVVEVLDEVNTLVGELAATCVCSHCGKYLAVYKDDLEGNPNIEVKE